MWYTNMVEAFVWEQEKTFNELLKAGQGGWGARGFWERHRSAFFDVRVCHPNAVSYRDLEPQQIYRIHENEKSVFTQRESWTSSMEHLHLWSSPQLTEWERST